MAQSGLARHVRAVDDAGPVGVGQVDVGLLLVCRVCNAAEHGMIAAVNDAGVGIRKVLPFAVSQSPNSPRERKLEAKVTSSRTTQPSAPSTFDSMSSSFTPTLPMCGNVKVTICAA